MKKDPECNRSGRELGVHVPYSDVFTPVQACRIGCCPKDIEETSAIFQVALAAHDSLFVSLHDQGEHSEKRNSDFWENPSLERLQVPGWTIKKTAEREIDRRPADQDPEKKARIVESTLTATSTDGKETRTLTHLRFSGWQDASPLPSEELFYSLVGRIAQLCRPEDRPWINCIGGKGRSGSTAVALWCVRFIDSELAAGKKPEDVMLNIPERIYDTFRTQRKGVVGQTSHLVSLYRLVGRRYEELRGQAEKK